MPCQKLLARMDSWGMGSRDIRKKAHLLFGSIQLNKTLFCFKKTTNI
jgi:hypothetical protein